MFRLYRRRFYLKEIFVLFHATVFMQYCNRKSSFYKNDIVFRVGFLLKQGKSGRFEK